MKIQNMNLASCELRRGPDEAYQGDENGVFDLPQKLADALVGTPGWLPCRARKPARASKPVAEAPKAAPPAPEPEEEDEAPAAPVAAAEEPEEEEEDVPPYEEWSMDDLKAEAKNRSLEVSGRSKAAFAEALEADDTED